VSVAITISAESPLTEDGRRLIEGSEAALREVYAPDECFTFTAEELDRPEVDFLVARKDGEPVGCVAMVTSCNDYAEVKRLFVPVSARGLGIAKALMDHLEDMAKASGIDVMRLETGPKLAAAIALYSARGYVECGRFGGYEDHPASLFMEKRLG
jgi:putative acetyltransferase